jgi:hypothetical protein
VRKTSLSLLFLYAQFSDDKQAIISQDRLRTSSKTPVGKGNTEGKQNRFATVSHRPKPLPKPKPKRPAKKTNKKSRDPAIVAHREYLFCQTKV